VENIDHTRTKTKSPQTNGIVERFHKTLLNEFYRVSFRRKIYRGLEELQADLDDWLREYNQSRSHQGRRCYGKTPLQTFVDSIALAREKILSPVELTPARSREDDHGGRGNGSVRRARVADSRAPSSAASLAALHS
jgi:Integrase core domain